MCDFEEDGLIGEKKFRTWLDELKVEYLWIAQSPETFAAAFHGKAKRPDVLVSRGGGRIAVIEVKHKRPGFWAGCDKACFGVEKETDIKRLGEFEQGFGIPVWFAFFDGWNYDRIDLWRIAKRSELQVHGLKTGDFLDASPVAARKAVLIGQDALAHATAGGGDCQCRAWLGGDTEDLSDECREFPVGEERRTKA